MVRHTPCGAHQARWLRIIQRVATKASFLASSICYSRRFSEYVLFCFLFLGFCVEMVSNYVFGLSFIAARGLPNEADQLSVQMFISWGMRNSLKKLWIECDLYINLYRTNWLIIADIQRANRGLAWSRSKKSWGGIFGSCPWILVSLANAFFETPHLN